MVDVSRIASICGLCVVLALPAAGAPKLDKETCDQLKDEQGKFMQTGIVSDLQKGPVWGKANLSAERLREVEHFILLDEQLKFGCRQGTLTADVLRAGEAAKQLELNPILDTDPDDEGKDAGSPGKPAAKAKAVLKPRADRRKGEPAAAAEAQGTAAPASGR